MYTDHFGLARNPFTPLSTAPPPFRSRELEEALAHFQYAQKNREGFFLLVGEVGTGKSTAVRAIVEMLEPDTPVAVVKHTSLDARELLEEVLRRFGIDARGPASKPVLLARLEQFLASSPEGLPAVLILDEAHLLSHAALEEVRLLSNLKQGDRPLLQICLVGQPELLNRLRQHRLRPLRQRIAVRYIVGSLSRQETREYIANRLSAAGAADPRAIFSDEAADLVHELTEGLPREINVVASQAMLNAYLENASIVKPSHVRTTKRDYGFEGVRVDRTEAGARPRADRPESDRPSTSSSSQAAPEAERVRREEDGNPGARKASSPDLPLHAERPREGDPPKPRRRERERPVLTTHPPSSGIGSRAIWIAAVLLLGIGAAFVLYTSPEDIEQFLPDPPSSSAMTPSPLDQAAIAPPPSPPALDASPAPEAETELPSQPEPPTSPPVEPPVLPREAPASPPEQRPADVSPGLAAAATGVSLPAPPTPSATATAADRLELGARLARSGRLDDAIAAFREAVALDPDYTDALHNLGVSLLEKGEAAEAAEVLARSTSRAPSDPIGQRSLGIALRQTGRLEESAAALRRALELAPNDTFALRHLASVLREMGQHDAAVEVTRRAIEVNPDDPALHQELGFALRSAGRLPEATAAFQRAIDLDAASALAHYSLGVTLLEMGYPGDGERAIEQARRLGYDPKD